MIIITDGWYYLLTKLKILHIFRQLMNSHQYCIIAIKWIIATDYKTRKNNPSANWNALRSKDSRHIIAESPSKFLEVLHSYIHRSFFFLCAIQYKSWILDMDGMSTRVQSRKKFNSFPRDNKWWDGSTTQILCLFSHHGCPRFTGKLW